MRICFVTEYFPTGSHCDIRGGAEAVAFYEAKYLSREHEIEVITSRERGTNREDIIEFDVKKEPGTSPLHPPAGGEGMNRVKVYRCGLTRKYVQKNDIASRFLFMRSAYLFGIRQNYDLVVGFSILSYPVAWKISQKIKVPCTIRYHDVLLGKWVKTFGLTGLIGELLERYTLSRKFDAIIAVSNYTAGNLGRYFRDQEKIHVVHNGVEAYRAANQKTTSPTIVCVSRLVRYKHVDDLLKAIPLLMKDFPDLHCKIIGTGPEEGKLRDLAIRLGIDRNITLTGFVRDHTEVLEIIGSSHVFCLPSSLEGFGIVITESMACGIPFVAANIPPILEATNQKGGLFFHCRDVEDLAEKIRMILKDKQLQERLKDEGLERAKELQWNDISGKVEAIYKNTVNEWI